MSIEYDLFSNPPKEGEEKPFLHAKAISYRTIGTRELADLIAKNTTFSSADIKGALEAISNQLIAALSNSHNVHLDGIGTFSITLKNKPVKEKKDIRSASVSFKNISFRADAELKKQFRGVEIERRPGRSKKVAYDEEVRIRRILWYIRKYGTINQTAAAQLNQCTRHKSKADLDKLEDERIIQRNWCGRRAFYVIATPPEPTETNI